MLAQDFDAVVERALKRIPARFRRRLENVAIVVEAEPPSMRGGTLLGLYEGRPLPKRSVSEPFAMPDRITIFQGPIERMARSYADLERIVYETVWHEIAHYFGMDERQVRDAERRRALARLRRERREQHGRGARDE
jgi:predicted Zn-dependent protease with MMP-like domain